MVKRAKAKGAKTGSKTKKGTKYICDVCGMVVTVYKECGCDPCNITCCGQDMTLLTCY